MNPSLLIRSFTRPVRLPSPVHYGDMQAPLYGFIYCIQRSFGTVPRRSQTVLIRRTLVASVCDGVSLFERIRRHYLNPLILLTESFSVSWSIDEWPVSVLYDPSSFGCRHRQTNYH